MFADKWMSKDPVMNQSVSGKWSFFIDGIVMFTGPVLVSFWEFASQAKEATFSFGPKDLPYLFDSFY